VVLPRLRVIFGRMVVGDRQERQFWRNDFETVFELPGGHGIEPVENELRFKFAN
jgi:hypothetical protein